MQETQEVRSPSEKIDELGWESLAERRAKLKVAMMFKFRITLLAFLKISVLK